jgi:hypothetical protein
MHLLPQSAIVVFVGCSSKQRKETKKMSKAVTQATSGHNLRVMMAIVALAVVLLGLTLVAVLQRAPTTTDRGEANRAMSAEGKGGSTSVNDDLIKRHAEVVQRLGGGSLR